MLILRQNYIGDIKPDKLGGMNRANKAVKTRQKREIVDNQMCHRIDRADEQRNSRKNKRMK